MHAPDGFLNGATAIVTGGLAVGAVGYSLRQARSELQDKQIALAGVSAAFIFAAQMVNFPVASGTTGHLLGGALAAILLGPAVGALVVSVVVVVQALAFADGGLTALGYNTLNMAIVTAFGGWAAFRLLRRILPDNRAGVVAAGGLAAGISVVLSSMAFSIQWLFGATAEVGFDTVFGAMVGVHALIGIGEGFITALALGAVLAARPDLVVGARDVDPAALRADDRIPLRAFVIAGIVVALVVGTIVSQFAVDNPDGLERVAEDEGFIESGTDHALDSFIFADYATSGVDNETLSLAIAGVSGIVVTLAVFGGMVLAVRPSRTSGRREQSTV